MQEDFSTFFSFQKLLVWQKAREFVKCVYSVLNRLPASERFVLADQLRRAAISVPSNIAEGSAKESPRDQVRFIEIAYGSLMESFCQLQLAEDLGYIFREDFEALARRVQEIARMLSGLRASKREKSDSPSFFKH
ncbi:MAG: four helix bundle protein [Candidatus Spyradosoma sp.]